MTKRNTPELTTAQIAVALGANSYLTGEPCPYTESDGGVFYDWHEGYEAAEAKSAQEDGLNA